MQYVPTYGHTCITSNPHHQGAMGQEGAEAEWADFNSLDSPSVQHCTTVSCIALPTNPQQGDLGHGWSLIPSCIQVHTLSCIFRPTNQQNGFRLCIIHFHNFQLTLHLNEQSHTFFIERESLFIPFSLQIHRRGGGRVS